MRALKYYVKSTIWDMKKKYLKQSKTVQKLSSIISNLQTY